MNYLARLFAFASFCMPALAVAQNNFKPVFPTPNNWTTQQGQKTIQVCPSLTTKNYVLGTNGEWYVRVPYLKNGTVSFYVKPLHTPPRTDMDPTFIEALVDFSTANGSATTIRCAYAIADQKWGPYKLEINPPVAVVANPLFARDLTTRWGSDVRENYTLFHTRKWCTAAIVNPSAERCTATTLRP